MNPLPALIEDETTLNEVMTRPGDSIIEFIRGLSSPLVILGAGGKMGPTLAVLARRAADAAGVPLDIVAVSRFSDLPMRDWLKANRIKTLSLDLLEPKSYSRLPDSKNVIYMVGLKFGTSQNPGNTWIMNTLVPAYTAERYAGSRIAALSTGNVYPLVPVESGGALESTPMDPVGEYGNACMARERIFEYYSIKQSTPIALLRLNYAIDLRYGVLADIGQRVRAGQPIDLTTGYLNCIWQGDANDLVIRSLPLSGVPAKPLNLTYPQVFSIRDVALQMGVLLGKEPVFTGGESTTAFLSNPRLLCSELGDPPTQIETMLRWIAHWTQINGRLLNKPTHFDVRDGKY